MNAYLDASGGPGTTPGGEPKQYFVLALVMFDLNATRGEAECAQRIDLLRAELGLGPNLEFHFTKNKPAIRRAFLQAVCPFEFRYSAFVAHKDRAKLEDMGAWGRAEFYKLALRIVFLGASAFLPYPHVVMDEGLPPAFARTIRRDLNSVLLRKLGPRPLSGFSFARSTDSNLLQLADYVAGVVRRHYYPSGSASLRRESEAQYQLIQPKEIRVSSWNR